MRKLFALAIPAAAMLLLTAPNPSAATSVADPAPRRLSIYFDNTNSPYDAWVTLYASVLGVKKQMGTGMVKAGKGDYVQIKSENWPDRVRVELHEGKTVYCDTDMATTSSDGHDRTYKTYWNAKTKKCWLESRN